MRGLRIRNNWKVGSERCAPLILIKSRSLSLKCTRTATKQRHCGLSDQEEMDLSSLPLARTTSLSISTRDVIF